MFFLPILLSGALAFGAGVTGEKTEFTCNVRSSIKGVKGSVQEQFEQLKKKVTATSEPIKEDEQKVEQNIADDETEVQTANNDDVSEPAADLETQEAVSTCMSPNPADDFIVAVAEMKKVKN